MLYLWTRLRIGLWYVRKRPPVPLLARMKNEGIVPWFLQNNKDTAAKFHVKANAFRDFLDRRISDPQSRSVQHHRV